MPPQLTFGTRGQVSFRNDNEFYEALGFLSKNNGTTSLNLEHNEMQGAWGQEGRIHFYEDRDGTAHPYPQYFSRAFTRGTGNIIHRINCNEYMEYIVINHGFQYSGNQNVQAILSSIPNNFHSDFYRGLTL